MILFYLSFVQIQQSEAFVPALILPAAIGVSLLVVGAMTYYKPSSVPATWPGSTMLTTAGNIARVAIGAQSAFDQYNNSILQGNLVSLTASALAMWAAFTGPNATANQLAYPSMFNYLSATGSGPQPLSETNCSNGSIVSIGGNNYTVSNVSHYYYGDGATDGLLHCNRGDGTNGCLSPGTSYNVFETFCSPGFSDVWHGDLTSAAPTTPTVKTPDALQAITPGGVIPQGAANDLDAMIAANANGFGISIMDATTPGAVDNSRPLVPPLPVVSPLNPAAPAVTGLSTPNVIATQTALTAAQASLATATANNTAAQAALAANPTSIPLQTAATAAAAALAAAQASAATAAQTATAAAAANAEIYPNASIDALLAIDFSPFMGLSGAFANVWPFCLLGTIAAMLSPLVASPVAPCFTLGLPLGQSLTIDLSIFDPVALVLRWVVGLCLTIGAIMGMVRFWRGVA